MRYMVLVYDCDWSPDVARRDAVLDYVSMLRERGVFRGADPLQGTHAATTVTVREGETLLRDGPFAETREWFAGYFLLECRDLDEALELAGGVPDGGRSRGGGASRCDGCRSGTDSVDELREALNE